MRYVDCQLTFLNDHDGEYTDVKFAGLKKVQGQVGDHLGIETVKKLNEWIRDRPEVCNQTELSLLGLHLYRIAFDTVCDPSPENLESRPLKAAFEATYEWFKLQDPKKTKMRLKLVFKKEVKELAGLPWEFLCRADDQGKGQFLARETDLILTRFVPEQETDWPCDEDSDKLRILVVTAQPEGEGHIKNEGLIKEIESLTLQNPSENIEVKVFKERATLRLLQKCISGSGKEQGYCPHIVHLMAHGQEGKIALLKDLELYKSLERHYTIGSAENRSVEKPSGAEWLNADSLKELFNKHKPRVLFLHACDGAAENSLGAFCSIARDMAYLNIPAVIAMQYQIDNKVAEQFAIAFYRQLRGGAGVDEAVTEARRELGGTVTTGRGVWSHRDFGTPVIYLQTTAPIIVPGPTTAERSDTGPSGIEARRFPCPNGIKPCMNFVLFKKPICTKCRAHLAWCPECGEPFLPEDGMCENGHELASKPSSQVTPPQPKPFDQPSEASKDFSSERPSIEGATELAKRQKVKGVFGPLVQ